MRKAIYLFCFARTKALPGIAGTGIDEKSPLFLYRYRNVASVLSRVDVAEFSGPEAEAHLRDLSWVGPRAMKHQQVIGEVARRSPVLPARFATLFSSERRLARLVQDRYPTITDFLGRVADKEEWAVKGFLDRTRAAEGLYAQALDRRGSALPSSPGARYFEEQRLKVAAERELNAWLKKTSRSLSEAFGRIALDSVARKVLPAEIANMEGEMVLNWAFLIPRSGREDFQRVVEQANASLQDRGLLLTSSGPWPPYSFTPALDMESAA